MIRMVATNLIGAIALAAFVSKARQRRRRDHLMRWYALMLVALAPIEVKAQVRLDTREVAAAIDGIRGERLRVHMRFLSDDLLEGRGTGTRGHEIAARYVAAQFEAIGLEAPLGRYLHPVPIRGAQVDGARTTLELQRRNVPARTLEYETDFLVSPDLGRTEGSIDAEVVFAGYCVSAPEFRYDDFKDADLRGKLVGCLSGAPPSFPKSAQSRFSAVGPKYDSLAARGAVGMVGLRPPESEQRWPWPVLAGSFKSTWMDWVDDHGNPGRTNQVVRGSIVLSASAAAELFASAPLRFDEARALTDAGNLRPFDLGARLRLHQATRHTDMQSMNVVGLLRGSDPVLRDEFVVYTAHVDHLGVGTAVNGDSIYNGASDNASGTAALIEIARSFAAMLGRPRRSILFVGVTGEEAGLAGSDFFVRNPPVAAEKIVADINVDGIAATHPALADVVAIGGEYSTLGKAAQLAAQRVGLELSPDPAPERLYFILGDQYSFIKTGIPSVWMISGDKSRDPSIDVRAFRKRWNETIYHTPTDDMAQSFNWTSATLFTRVQFLIGYIVGNSTARPSWNAGDPIARQYAPKNRR